MPDEQLSHQLGAILVFLKKHKLRKACKKLRKQLEKDGLEFSKYPHGHWQWVPYEASTSNQSEKSKNKKENDKEDQNMIGRSRTNSPDTGTKQRKQSSGREKSQKETVSSNKSKKDSPMKAKTTKNDTNSKRKHRRHSSVIASGGENTKLPPDLLERRHSSACLKDDDSIEALSLSCSKPILSRAESETIINGGTKLAGARSSHLKGTSVELDSKPPERLRGHSSCFNLGYTEQHLLLPRKQYRSDLYFQKYDPDFVKIEEGNEKLHQATLEARAILNESASSLRVDLDSNESSDYETSESSTCATDFDDSVAALEHRNIKEAPMMTVPSRAMLLKTASLLSCRDDSDSTLSNEAESSDTETSESSTCATDFDDSVAAMEQRNIREMPMVGTARWQHPKKSASMIALKVSDDQCHGERETPNTEKPSKKTKKAKKKKSKKSAHKDDQKAPKSKPYHRRHSASHVNLTKQESKRSSKAQPDLRRASSCDQDKRRPSLSVWKPLSLPE